MNYFSTRNKSKSYTFQEAMTLGLAPDGGLFVPEFIPKLDAEFLDKLPSLNRIEMALEIMQLFTGDEIDRESLRAIISKTLSFDFPLSKVDDDVYSLELFHGPTAAFKDVGATFLANAMGYFAKDAKEINVLVATSGDTGSAVANGFHKVKGVNVSILYPSGKVSELQEKQLTTFGANITAYEVKGSFDDCQAIVKKAFSDNELNSAYNLSSANSINIARLLPQMLYYFDALRQFQKSDKKIVLSVPSGNFGNILAAIYASKMGLKIDKFVISNNLNNSVYNYLKQGEYKPVASVQTISNAMDVGDPSNFERLVDLIPDIDELRELTSAFFFNNQQNKEYLAYLLENKDYLADPHGAIAYAGLCKEIQNGDDFIGIFAETAHPAKFSEVYSEVQLEKLTMPKNLERYLDRVKVSYIIKGDYESFKMRFLEITPKV